MDPKKYSVACTMFNSLSRRFVLVLLAACYLSWALPPTEKLWNYFDRQGFLILNSTLGWSPYWALFWAYMNTNISDRIMEALVFLPIFVGTYRLVKEKGPVYLYELLLYYGLLTLTSLLVKYILNQMLGLYRISPSYCIEGSIRLQGLLPYKLKDAS